MAVVAALRALVRLHDALTLAGYYGACLALAVMLGAYTAEVFGRYFFNAPQWWASEAVSYSLCIGTFLMMPYVTWKRGHVAVGLLLNLLPRAAVGPALRFTVMLGFIACTLAGAIALEETVRQWVQDVHIMAVRPVPKYLISVFIPFGFILSALHFLRLVFATNLDAGAIPGTIQD